MHDIKNIEVVPDFTHHPDWKAHKHEILDVMPNLPSSFVDPYITEYIARRGSSAYRTRLCHACDKGSVFIRALREQYATPTDC